MSRLPNRLQRFWPLFKRVHRRLAVLLGLVFRALAPAMGDRGLPRRATKSSRETAKVDPSVTFHPGGTAQQLTRIMPLGSPPDHWRFQAELTATVPERYVLEVREGTVIGELGAVVTAGGVLDYETSGYFGIASWREHPLFLSPRLPAAEHVPGTLLNLTTRGTSANYYHFLLDALPRLGILQEAMPGVRFDAIIVPHATGYQRQLLHMLGVDSPLLQPTPRAAYRADRLLVPSTPNQDLVAPPWACHWLRDRLPAGAYNDTPRRLYLTRGERPNTRRLVDEPAVVRQLRKRGFTSVNPGALTVQEQIDLFAGAECIVAPHGAALTNLLFCRPGTRVLELFAASYVHLGLWAIAEAVGGIGYRYLVADEEPVPGKPMVGVLDDIRIPAQMVVEHVDELIDARGTAS